MFEMYVVRHGQSMANGQNIIQGQTSTPLSPLGERQAAALAEKLEKVRFNAVYSSDLERAAQTAKYAAPYMDAVLCKELREWNLGVFQGLPLTKVLELYPDEWDKFMHGTGDYRVPNGESQADINARVASFLQRMERENTEGKILVVSHGGTIRSMLKYILGLTTPWPTRPQMTNTAVSRFIFQNGLWQLGTWNDISHLEGLMPTAGNY